MMPLTLAIETLQNSPIRFTEKTPHETCKEKVFIEFIDEATSKTYGTVTLFTPKEENIFGDSCLFEIKSEYQYTPKHYEFLRGFDAIQAIQKHIRKRTLMESLQEIIK